MGDKEVQWFSVRLPVNLHLQARIKCIKTGRTLNEVIVEKLAEWVKEREEPEHEAAQSTVKSSKK